MMSAESSALLTPSLPPLAPVEKQHMQNRIRLFIIKATLDIIVVNLFILFILGLPLHFVGRPLAIASCVLKIFAP